MSAHIENYFGFPEQQDAPFQFRHSGTNIKALTYGNLGTGASTSIGFNGRWSGTYSSPTAFTLNGVACNGGTGPTTPPPAEAATTSMRCRPRSRQRGPCASMKPDLQRARPASIAIRALPTGFLNQCSRKPRKRSTSTSEANDWRAEMTLIRNPIPALLAVLLMPLLTWAPVVHAADIVLFQPGQSSWEWLLVPASKARRAASGNQWVASTSA